MYEKMNYNPNETTGDTRESFNLVFFFEICIVRNPICDPN